MVRAVEHPFLGLRVGHDDAALSGGGLRQQVVERRVAADHVLDVAGAAPHVHAVDVDVGEGFGQRVKRVFGVELRTEQAGFLRRRGQEQDRARHGGGERLESPREGQHGRHPGRVVHRAVVDPRRVRRVVHLAEVVPVGAVNDPLVLQLGVTAVEPGEHVARLERAHGVVDHEVRPRARERHRPKIPAHRRLFQGVEILARVGQQRFCHVEGDPRAHGHRTHVPVWGIDDEIFLRPARTHHRVGIPGRAGFVDDDRGGSPPLGGDLVLVGPASVVRHRLALEHRLVQPGRIVRVRHGRVADEHQDRLAAHVHVLVVVPAVLGRDHPVADEHDLRIVHADLRHEARGGGDEIVRVVEHPRPAAGTQVEAGLRDDPGNRNLLDERAVRVAGLEADLFELLGDVADR